MDESLSQLKSERERETEEKNHLAFRFNLLKWVEAEFYWFKQKCHRCLLSVSRLSVLHSFLISNTKIDCSFFLHSWLTKDKLIASAPHLSFPLTKNNVKHSLFVQRSSETSHTLLSSLDARNGSVDELKKYSTRSRRVEESQNWWTVFSFSLLFHFFRVVFCRVLHRHQLSD